jgi:hypothetical protein
LGLARAPGGRQMLAHGVSRGIEFSWSSPAPAGRHIIASRKIVSPLMGLGVIRVSRSHG